MRKRGRPKTDNTQVNIAIPTKWKIALDNLARIYSVERGEDITFQDLMREAIYEKFQLEKLDDGKHLP